MLDILRITETELDYSSPEQQLHVAGFNIPFRLNHNRYGGELLSFVRNNINAAVLKNYTFPDKIEAFFTEIFLKSSKWLIYRRNNPNRFYFATHLGEIDEALNTYGRKYENTLLMNYFNVEPDETNMKAFSNQYKPKTLNKESTRLKNFDKPSCIGLIQTNSSKYFENCLTLEADLSDFQLIATVLKTKYERFPP